jgi:hypothetical protein
MAKNSTSLFYDPPVSETWRLDSLWPGKTASCSFEVREIFGSVDGPLSVKAARFLSQAKKKKF